MKKINVHPFHCEFAGTTEGFTLTFYDRTESGTDLRYILHFEFWWLRFLARHLWAAINYRKAEADKAAAAMQEMQP